VGVEHEDGIVSDSLYEKAKPVLIFSAGTCGYIRQGMGKRSSLISGIFASTPEPYVSMANRYM
jgi:hypothetical protein